MSSLTHQCPELFRCARALLAQIPPNPSQPQALVVLLLLAPLLALGAPLPLSRNSEASLLGKALPLPIAPPVHLLKKSVMTRRTMFLETIVPEMMVPMVMILMVTIPNPTMMMMKKENLSTVSPVKMMLG